MSVPNTRKGRRRKWKRKRKIGLGVVYTYNIRGGIELKVFDLKK
jgi:hypothetical protein